jgi:hypothetical protein
MILPSINILNCWNILRAKDTIPSGNEMANRENSLDWTISSQASLKDDEGSSTTNSTLTRLSGMGNFARMGWMLLLVMLPWFSTVEANMISLRHDNKVFESIIIDNPVNMVDNFVRGQVSSKMLFNNEPVFHNAVSIVLVGMSISILHDIASVPGNVTRVERVGKLKSAPSGYLGHVVCTQPNKLSRLLSAHSGSRHVPEYFNGSIPMIAVQPGYVKSLQVDEDKLLGNPVLLGNSKHGSELSVIMFQLFLGDEKFSFHGSAISPYSLMSSKKASRYSQNLQETVRREDKESLDNRLEIRDQGDTVIIRTIPTLTISDYVKGQKLNYERPESTALELLIDKGKYFSFVCDDIDKKQADIKLMNIWSDDAAEQMKITIDAQVLQKTPMGTPGHSRAQLPIRA